MCLLVESEKSLGEDHAEGHGGDEEEGFGAECGEVGEGGAGAESAESPADSEDGGAEDDFF